MAHILYIYIYIYMYPKWHLGKWNQRPLILSHTHFFGRHIYCRSRLYIYTYMQPSRFPSGLEEISVRLDRLETECLKADGRMSGWGGGLTLGTRGAGSRKTARALLSPFLVGRVLLLWFERVVGKWIWFPTGPPRQTM